MAARVAHTPDTTEYATREDLDVLRAELQTVLDFAGCLFDVGREFERRFGPAARPPRSLRQARAGLRLAASEGERLIREASVR